MAIHMTGLGDPVHHSNLRRMARSPAHYRASIEHHSEPTRAMRIGTLVHSLVLGGPGIVIYDGERRGNRWDEFKRTHSDSSIYTRSEHDEADSIAMAVKRDTEASQVLAKLTHAEAFFAWRSLGRECAGTIDAISDEYLVELKTTSCAEPNWFSYHCRKMAYHAQLAWYLDAVPRQRALIIAVETEFPFPVVVYDVSVPSIVEGTKLNRLWLERVKACEAENVWPGYAQAVLPIEIGGELELEGLDDG